MQIYQTKKQLESLTIPSRLEWLREIQKRNGLCNKQGEELFRLEVGLRGEREVIKRLKSIGLSDWLMIQNLWLKHFGLFECDFVLLTHYGLKILEIKNYNGNYEYLNSQFLLDGKSIGQNPISQTQRTTINFKDLMHHSNLQVPVSGGLVFTGDHFDLKITDSIAELDVLNIQQLSVYLNNIKKNERKKRGRYIDKQKILHVIEQNVVVNPYQPGNVDETMKQKIKKGILCSHCGSSEVKFSENYLECVCKTREPKENAIVRTICEYGVINFEKNLILSELIVFFDGQISHVTLRKYLRKHFVEVGSHRNTYFINKRLPFIKLITDFDLSIKYIEVINSYK